jgi:putative phosphoesterase
VLLAVISDTHLDGPSDWFKRFFDEHLRHAEALIHCGDTTGLALHDFMAQNHPNFHGVAGNCCDWRVSQELPSMLRLNLAGKTIGVAHGWGDRPSLPARLPEAFGPGFDLILFGHTHRQTKLQLGDTLVVNPGSLSSEKGCMAYVRLGDDIEVEFRCFTVQK